jgi:hypothetical protein
MIVTKFNDGGQANWKRGLTFGRPPVKLLYPNDLPAPLAGWESCLPTKPEEVDR